MLHETLSELEWRDGLTLDTLQFLVVDELHTFDGAQGTDLACLIRRLKERLKRSFNLPYDRTCKHEFVLSAQQLKERFGVTALDVAKRLLDFGIHPPTVYFPLIVPEALMIEPTETENIEVLDRFVEVMETILQEAKENPEALRQAPSRTPVGRIDEVLAARKPVVRWHPENGESSETGAQP